MVVAGAEKVAAIPPVRAEARFSPRRSNRKKGFNIMSMPTFTMRQLIEAGVHFGHTTRRWNPKMKPYLFGERNGVQRRVVCPK